MLDKTNYSSWASRIQLYIKGKLNGKLLVDCVLNGPFQYVSIVEPRTDQATVRARTYTDLTDEEKLCKSVDTTAINIVLQVHQQQYQAPILQQSYQSPAIQESSSTELDLGLMNPSFNPFNDPIAN
uniref:Integrase, catalytic region, zinc finger, CCHC-type, peptidase aspartic, catalytic n=1 Tax=Tanacetum cinerariifolium TaxID=118510 RepID=A0A6L2NHQ8_TANCI|nr:hypothetical protein [Tanacetum cinerariifolium]